MVEAPLEIDDVAQTPLAPATVGDDLDAGRLERVKHRAIVRNDGKGGERARARSSRPRNRSGGAAPRMPGAPIDVPSPALRRARIRSSGGPAIISGPSNSSRRRVRRRRRAQSTSRELPARATEAMVAEAPKEKPTPAIAGGGGIDF